MTFIRSGRVDRGVEPLEIVTVVVLVLLLSTFFALILWLRRRILPLIDQFTSESGEFQIPKVNIKQAIGYAIVKAVDQLDMSAVLGQWGKKK